MGPYLTKLSEFALSGIRLSAGCSQEFLKSNIRGNLRSCVFKIQAPKYFCRRPSDSSGGRPETPPGPNCTESRYPNPRSAL